MGFSTCKYYMINKNIPLIPVRYYLRLIELLVARQISMQPIFDELDIDVLKFQQQPDLKVSINQVEKFIQYCLSFPENRDLAFELGASLRLSSHSLVGYAILTSETLEHALILVTRYFNLIMPSFKASIRYDHEQLELLIEPDVVMEQLTLNFHIEAIAVALHHNICELLNDEVTTSYSIFLSTYEPLYLNRFRQLKQVKFHFNALLKSGIKIVFTQALLNYKLPLADDMTLKAVEIKCQEQMKEITRGQDFPEWIRMMLMNTYHIPTLAECAQLLHVSTKTLQRQLNKQEKDFNHIKKEVILSRAKQRLTQSNVSITDIAYELGYSSSSNFSRAFKALTSLTPEQYRLKHKG